MRNTNLIESECMKRRELLMKMSNYLLKVFVMVFFFTILFTSVLYAADLWSIDLWKEPAPSVDKNNTDNRTLGNPSGGLWSEGLWSEGLWENTQAPEPKPIEKPLPANSLDENSYILIMQVANNKAKVRGVEKEIIVPPTFINDNLMVPLKFIGDALNATVSYSEAERKTTMFLDNKRVEIWGGKTVALINGYAVQLDAPPVVLDGATLVPIRFASENFGYSMEYDKMTRTVKLSESGESQDKPQSKPEPIPEPEPKPIPEPKPDPKPEPKPELEQKPILDSDFNYFGVWNLHMGGRSQGMFMGTLIVREDGTYAMKHGIYGTAIGKWRQGEKDEVIGHKDMLILENGPDGIDWVMIPKSEGMVSVRYHYGYDIQNKIWFEDSLGIQVEK